MGLPARGHSYEPFKAGNQVALRHGAWSDRLIDPIARDLVERTVPMCEWWRPADMASAQAWARTEARIVLLEKYLAEQGGDIDEDGKVRAAADLLTRLEARAEQERHALGLDPLSRSRLGRDQAAGQFDLAKLWAMTAESDGTPEVEK